MDSCALHLYGIYTEICSLNQEHKIFNFLKLQQLKYLKYSNMLNTLWKNGLNDFDKTVTLVPIPKPRKDIHDLKSYRAVSLSNTSIKILNEAVKDDIERHLKTKKLIPDLSFGFRKNYSTVDCINTAIETIKCLRRKNFFVAIISFDCEKAFG